MVDPDDVRPRNLELPLLLTKGLPFDPGLARKHVLGAEFVGFGQCGRPLDGVILECQVIRLLTKRNVEVGVNFTRIKAAAEKKIIDFLKL